jgi:hypothetical protein
MSQQHNIQWITLRKTDGNEWKYFYKEANVSKKIDRAIIRFQSDCVCAVYINDEFIISGTGHYPERVNCHEVTHAVKEGENLIEIRLGTRWYQQAGRTIKERRGYWYSSVAFELELLYTDGTSESIATDADWSGKEEVDTPADVYEIVAVSDEEYERLWRSAALWEECSAIETRQEIVDVIGEEYKNYVASASVPSILFPVDVYETNMSAEELPIKHNGEIKERAVGEDRYVVYDFGRLVVGYMKVEITSEEDAELWEHVEHIEKAEQLMEDEPFDPAVERMRVSCDIQKGTHTYTNLHRRAFRYVKVIIKGTEKAVSVREFSLLPCMYPVKNTGWFACDDKELCDIWEVGKYTLHVNKHQEYESCPRNEAKFFAGDGIVAALTDYYAFGDHALVDASLSLGCFSIATGRMQSFAEKNATGLWDYPGWRIVTIYNEYRYHRNMAFLHKFYEDAVQAIEWYISRMNTRDLIYNIQLLSFQFWMDNDGVEWTDSGDRLGEKASLNSLFYKCLLCMSELADVMDDTRGKYWKMLAERVKTAINKYLWSEEKQAYIDSECTYIAQDSNALAVLFGVAEGERAKATLETLKENLWSEYGSAICSVPLHRKHARGGLNTISPLMCGFETEAKFITGDSEGALELMKRCWGSMLRKGAKTFWEYAPNNEGEWPARSHGWSTGCTYILGAYVLGIRPYRYGWDTIVFDPQIGSLTDVRGVVPTSKGDIAVRISVKNGVKNYTLIVPKGIEVITDVSANELKIVTYNI